MGLMTRITRCVPVVSAALRDLGGFTSQPFSVNLVSTRASTIAAGTVQIKLGFVVPLQTNSCLDFDEVFAELTRRSRPSLVSAPLVHIVHLTY